MVNPVQSSGDQSLTDLKDSAAAVPASEYADGRSCATWMAPATSAGSGPTVKSSTGTPAF